MSALMDVRDAHAVSPIDSLPVAVRERKMVVNEQPVKASHQAAEALKDIAFGSAAGIAGKFVEYPFDTVKVRLQSQPDHLPLRYTGPVDCFRQSFRRDGFFGLYRGISAPLVGAALENSSLFFSYRLSQHIVQATVLPGVDPLPLSALVTCGAMSGAFTSLLLTPVELIKCKMQVPVEATTATMRATKQPGPAQLIASVYRHHGLMGFWHGQMGTLLRETGGSAAWFGSYEAMSSLFRSFRVNKQQTVLREDNTGDEMPLHLWEQMLGGAVAGMNYNFLFYPADTIKSRMQTEEVGALISGQQRKTFLSVGKGIWKQQGLKGMYRGCGITCLRSAPSSALIFSIYEGLKKTFG